MNKNFWLFCSQVKALLLRQSVVVILNADRVIIEDIETVATCFDHQKTAIFTAKLLLDRRKLTAKIME